MSLSTQAFKRFASGFFQAFGVIALVLGVLDILFPNHFQGGLGGIALISFASLMWAALVVWPRQVVSRQFSVPETKITITVGDLFNQEGNLVIGMNDVFDTEKGAIISPRSIQGQFLTRVYGDDREQLDRDLEDALKDAHGEQDKTKARGKNIRYPVGTVATIRNGTHTYFCVAYSFMGDNLQAKSELSMLSRSLDNLWDEVAIKGECKRIVMAVLGSNLARLGHRASHSELIQFIVWSYYLTAREKTICEELVIVIHPSDLGKVNLLELHNFLQKL